MRPPLLSALLLAAAVAIETPRSEGAAGAVPVVLVLERTDDAIRAEGMVARRLAVYADGSVLATRGRPELGHGRLDPTQMARLAERVAQARLVDLPAVIESRAIWCHLGTASASLSWSGLGAEAVRVDGDLRPGSADRALAPHGFVEVLEFLEAIPIEDAAVVDEEFDPAAVEFALDPWTGRDTSPFAALLELEPLPWPSGLPAPRAGTLRAEGHTASELFSAARLARPVQFEGRAWRVRARLLFPHETRGATAGRPSSAPRHG